jgi:3-deoxy-D-manno-octulosonate 8-phosphate phosphatase (KDO 8-P phosphatase)
MCATGFGVKLWQRLGFKTAIITGRRGDALRHRARELGIEHVIQGAEDKAIALQGLLTKLGLKPDQVACIGGRLAGTAPHEHGGLPHRGL